MFDYSSDTFEEHTITDIQELVKFKNTTTSSWINISGLHETKLIEKVGECFELDTLLLEDVLNTNHRPKVDFEHDLHRGNGAPGQNLRQFNGGLKSNFGQTG